MSSGREGGLRVVVVGKGGVGKTTLSALLARTLARGGPRVVAVDADEQRNLGATLGVDPAALARLVPLSGQGDYMEEKVGARPGEGAGAMLRLNPDARDVVERFAVPAPDGVRLLVMGGVQRAGGGCLCPETALLAAVVAGLGRVADEVVVMDTHAGVEHFGRALARGFDRALVVAEPTYNAIAVGLETARLAEELGIGDVEFVLNRCRGEDDTARAASHLGALGGSRFSSFTVVPFDPAVTRCEPDVGPLLEGSAVATAVAGLAARLRAGVATGRLVEGAGVG